MKLKPLLIAVILLAGLAAAAWFFNRPSASPLTSDARVDAPVVSRAIAGKVARVRLNKNDQTVLLAKDHSTYWKVTSDHDLPVALPKLSALVTSLTDTSIERLVTTSPDQLDRLGFSHTSISLMDESGAPLLTLYLGKNAEGGGRFIKFDHETKAYLARLNLSIDTTARQWVDEVLVSISPDDVAKIDLPFPDGKSVEITRADKSASFTIDDAPAGQSLKKNAATALLNTLAYLRFKDVSALGDAHVVAARQAARTLTLTLFDGRTLMFSIGREPEQLKLRPDATKPDLERLKKLIAEASKPTPEITRNGQSDPERLIKPLAQMAPAGPVYVFIQDSDPNARINTMMAQQAFQITESAFDAIPAQPEDLFEPVPVAEKQSK